MSLYEGATTKVRADSTLQEEVVVKVGIHQASMLSHFLFAVVMDVFTELAIEGVLNKLLYVDDLVLVSETIEGLQNNLRKLKEASESIGLKVNHGKPK